MRRGEDVAGRNAGLRQLQRHVGLPRANTRVRGECTLDVQRTLVQTRDVIESFRGGDLELIYAGRRSRRFGGLQRVIERKLALLEAAKTLDDLRSPPGNRLETLVGDRAGQYSIRVNDQYRICFRWTEHGPADVEIVDYH